MLDKGEKARRLATLLKRIAGDRDEDLEALAKSVPVLEGPAGDPQSANAKGGLTKLAEGRGAEASFEEIDGLEAIVMVRERPVAYVRGDRWDDLGDTWERLNTKAARARLGPLLASIGRIELPLNPTLPYGGTGFIVGRDLLMTNRHVAQIFTRGLGMRRLRFQSGGAAIDFKRERSVDGDDGGSAQLVVSDVVMVHPYWDMALLRVDGIPPERQPLKLSTRAPEDLMNRDVAVVGYPGRDDRNDLAVQDRIFDRQYYVKRFQPGKIRERNTIRSFENRVAAMTHDSSTLGGNSGSAIIDVERAEVIGLHFAGVYLRANYAVPTYELACDARVVDAGLAFTGDVAPTDLTSDAWAEAEGDERPANRATAPAVIQQVPTAGGPSATFTIPLEITVRIGAPTQAAAPPAPPPLPADEPDEAETEAFKMQRPILAPRLASRAGYQRDFLGHGSLVEPPALTSAGKKVAARLEDDSTELKYHHFSVVMHKRRRLALFVAADVDWRKESRLVNGKKPTRKELTGLDDKVIEEWVADPRIPQDHQLPDVFYTKDAGAFDKGHLVRRDDVAWGRDFKDIQKANGDTYYVTNCSPQVLEFNRSKRGGRDKHNWGDLENYVQAETNRELACVLSGPVLADDDKFFHGLDDDGDVSIQIPRQFWKIVVTLGDVGPEAYGFVLKQSLAKVPLHEEFVVSRDWQRKLATIEAIEELTGGLLSFAKLVPFDKTMSTEGARIGARL